MPTREEMIKELNWLTEHLSGRVWSVAVGVLATSLAFIVEAGKADGAPFLQPGQLIFPILLAILALTCDMLQYIASYLQYSEHKAKMQAQKAEFLAFDEGAVFAVWRTRAFRLKIVFAIGSVLWFIAISARAVFGMT